MRIRSLSNQRRRARPVSRVIGTRGGFLSGLGAIAPTSLTTSGTVTAGAFSSSGNASCARFLAADDTAGAPGHSYQNDLDAGLHRFGADAMAIVTAGAIRLGIGAAQVFTINQSTGSSFTGDERWVSDISPSQITSNQNDYNPTGLSSASRLRLSTDASRNITSLAGGADGRRVRILNVGAQNIVLTHDDGATGTAANRFLCPNNANVTIRQNGYVDVEYDSTSSRWRVMGA